MQFELLRKVFRKMLHLRFLRGTDMELHNALKTARTDASLSVSAVAQHLQVGRAQVWRMEKSADFISVEVETMMFDLADMLPSPRVGQHLRVVE